MHLSAIVAVTMTSWLMGVAVEGVDYCGVCADHTMCKYSGVADTCKSGYKNTVSGADQQVILDTHNKLRSQVASGKQAGQPPAANMMAMAWDGELAAVAQRWAEQCVFDHDKCRNVARFKVGQNAGMSMSSQDGAPPDWPKQIHAWYDEVQAFSASGVDVFQGGGGTGHYTQVVWAESYLIGCGYISFKGDTQNMPFTQHYMCNYGPAGNMLGAPIYLKGAGCSQCPPEAATCNAQYAGLCGNGNGNGNGMSLRPFIALQLTGVVIYYVGQRF